MPLTAMQLQHLLSHGKFYYPAGKHYVSQGTASFPPGVAVAQVLQPLPKVTCDHCGAANIPACLGEPSCFLDLCLHCAARAVAPSFLSPASTATSALAPVREPVREPWPAECCLGVSEIPVMDNTPEAHMRFNAVLKQDQFLPPWHEDHA